MILLVFIWNSELTEIYDSHAYNDFSNRCTEGLFLTLYSSLRPEKENDEPDQYIFNYSIT